MKGIDISAWQTNVDWQAVVNAEVEFVIVKLGEAGRLDTMFINHVNNAVAHKMRYGIYVYARALSVKEARAEADWTDRQIRQYLNGKNPELGIWYDMEDSTIANCGANITAICGNFIDRLNVLGYTYAGIYSSYNWLTNGTIDTAQLAEYVPYWCAQYNYECNFEHPNLRIWQYTDRFSDALPYDGNVYY